MPRRGAFSSQHIPAAINNQLSAKYFNKNTRGSEESKASPEMSQRRTSMRRTSFSHLPHNIFLTMNKSSQARTDVKRLELQMKRKVITHYKQEVPYGMILCNSLFKVVWDCMTISFLIYISMAIPYQGFLILIILSLIYCKHLFFLSS